MLTAKSPGPPRELSQGPRFPRVEPCRAAGAPTLLPFTGPVVFLPPVQDAPEPRVVFNVDGVPRIVALPPRAERSVKRAATVDASVSTPPPLRASSSACAVASSHVFCGDSHGAIHRTELGEVM